MFGTYAEATLNAVNSKQCSMGLYTLLWCCVRGDSLSQDIYLCSLAAQ